MAPKTVDELSDAQLRHLIVTKLPPTVGVEAYGAKRPTVSLARSTRNNRALCILPFTKIAFSVHTPEETMLVARAHMLSLRSRHLLSDTSPCLNSHSYWRLLKRMD